MTTFNINKGKLQVIELPEEPNLVGYTKEFAVEALKAYKDACTHARLHPIPVHPDDQEKVKDLMGSGISPVGNWELEEGKEYSVTGVDMKFDKIICPECDGVGYISADIESHACNSCNGERLIKVACLIEDCLTDLEQIYLKKKS
jgi:hypothetical protein